MQDFGSEWALQLPELSKYEVEWLKEARTDLMSMLHYTGRVDF